GFNQSTVLALVAAVLFGVCTFPFRDQYSVALSADATTAKLAVSYLGWFIPALMLQFPLVSLGSALRATGIIKPAVGLQVLSVVGAAAQAGFGVGARVMQAMFLPVIAIAFSVAPVVGQNFGGRRADRVRQTFYSAVLITSAVMVLLTIFAQFYGAWFIRGFTK